MTSLIPVQDIHAGREALRRDLEKYLRGASLTDKGWAQPDDLTLLVPLFATTGNGETDLYLLKLVFDHYPKFPPSAQFVNPITKTYSYPADIAWVPKIEGAASIHFHASYSDTCKQLICSSSTLEFYKVNHGVEEAHIWKEDRMTFLSTIAAIKAGLAPNYYKGRSAP